MTSTSSTASNSNCSTGCPYLYCSNPDCPYQTTMGDSSNYVAYVPEKLPRPAHSEAHYKARAYAQAKAHQKRIAKKRLKKQRKR